MAICLVGQTSVTSSDYVDDDMYMGGNPEGAETLEDDLNYLRTMLRWFHGGDYWNEVPIDYRSLNELIDTAIDIGNNSENHTHTISQITGLQGALDNLAPFSHIGSTDQHPLATGSSDGFMSAADFATIQSIGSIVSSSAVLTLVFDFYTTGSPPFPSNTVGFLSFTLDVGTPPPSYVATTSSGVYVAGTYGIYGTPRISNPSNPVLYSDFHLLEVTAWGAGRGGNPVNAGNVVGYDKMGGSGGGYYNKIYSRREIMDVYTNVSIDITIAAGRTWSEAVTQRTALTVRKIGTGYSKELIPSGSTYALDAPAFSSQSKYVGGTPAPGRYGMEYPGMGLPATPPPLMPSEWGGAVPYPSGSHVIPLGRSDSLFGGAAGGSHGVSLNNAQPAGVSKYGGNGGTSYYKQGVTTHYATDGQTPGGGGGAGPFSTGRNTIGGHGRIMLRFLR